MQNVMSIFEFRLSSYWISLALQYKSIAQVNEEALKQMELAHDKFKNEVLLILLSSIYYMFEQPDPVVQLQFICLCCRLMKLKDHWKRSFIRLGNVLMNSKMNVNWKLRNQFQQMLEKKMLLLVLHQKFPDWRMIFLSKCEFSCLMSLYYE